MCISEQTGLHEAVEMGLKCSSQHMTWLGEELEMCSEILIRSQENDT